MCVIAWCFRARGGCPALFGFGRRRDERYRRAGIGTGALWGRESVRDASGDAVVCRDTGAAARGAAGAGSRCAGGAGRRLGKVAGKVAGRLGRLRENVWFLARGGGSGGAGRRGMW